MWALGTTRAGSPRSSERSPWRLLRWPFLSAIVMCAALSRTGADGWVIVAFFVAWTGAGFVLALRFVKRGPPVVMKINAEGTNHATWLLIAPSLLLTLGAVVTGGPMLIPTVALAVLMVLVVLRARGGLPDVLRKVRPLLAEGETVLGDGIGVARQQPARPLPVGGRHGPPRDRDPVEPLEARVSIGRRAHTAVSAASASAGSTAAITASSR